MHYSLRRRPGQKYIRIRVEVDGSIVVSAPKRVSLRAIEKTVAASSGWIETQIARQKGQVQLLDMLQNRVLYLGDWYTVTMGDVHGVEIDEQCFQVGPVTGLESDLYPTLVSWLKREGRSHIEDRVAVWADRMEISYERVRFGQQKSRWGSCSSRGTLSFNWRLIHFAPTVIDYVVIHELAHRKHMNHSTAFWELVGAYQPDYRSARAILKRYRIRPV